VKLSRGISILAALVAISGASFATEPAGQVSALQGLSKVCLDAQTGDKLTGEFADRLKEAIAASGGRITFGHGQNRLRQPAS
jgi:hypothetical protein